MQSIDFVIDMMLIFTFITFYGTIAWGLIRYSKRQSFRLWAIGLLIYSIGALEAGFLSSNGLVPEDLIAYTGWNTFIREYKTPISYLWDRKCLLNLLLDTWYNLSNSISVYLYPSWILHRCCLYSRFKDRCWLRKCRGFVKMVAVYWFDFNSCILADFSSFNTLS